MRKRIVLLWLLIVLLTSCVSQFNALSVDANMRQVELGMSQSEVISIMGKSYQVIVQDQENCIWGYSNYGEDAIYKLRFEDGILKGWEKVWLKRIETPSHTQHIHTENTN